MLTENHIKKIIRSLKAHNQSIEATWDAGGDQTLCHVFIRQDTTDTINSIRNTLINKIIDKLALPNAGEVYHQGKGYIDINGQNQVYMKYSAVYHADEEVGIYPYDFYYKDWGIEEEEEDYASNKLNKLSLVTKLYTMQDPLQLYKLIHRAKITFMGRINQEYFLEKKFYLEIEQGDHPKFEDQDLAPYYKIIHEILKENLDTFRHEEARLKDQEGYIPFKSLIAEAILSGQGEITCTLKPSSEKFITYSNELVVLIP